jgi:glycosyltransferase involved in cell wall biosynthesis
MAARLVNLDQPLAPGAPACPARRRKLRVVTMVDCLMTSGAEILATQIAMELDSARFESIICSTRASAPNHVRAAEAAGVRVLALNRRSKLELWRWRPFVQLLRRERVDILHSHKHGSNVWAASLGTLAGVPLIVAHEHNWSYLGGSLSRGFRRTLDRHLVARFADVVLGTSAQHWRQMIEVRGVDPGKARYVSNGIPRLRPGNGAAVRRELGISDESPVIGTACTLRAEKALEVLVEAAAILVEDVPGLKVIIAGDGPERSRIEELIERLDLARTVLLIGHRSREALPDVLDALDVAISSSDSEAAPLSIMEFMAAGKPVVATQVGGVPALIDDGVEGLLVPPRAPAKLAAAVAELLSDTDRRATLGGQARERQRREFDLELMVHRVEDLYESLYWTSPRGRREAKALADGRASRR